MIADLIQAVQILPALMPFESTTSMWRAGWERQIQKTDQGAGHESPDQSSGGGRGEPKGVLLPRYSDGIIH